jgi:hypothetical protein
MNKKIIFIINIIFINSIYGYISSSNNYETILIDSSGGKNIISSTYESDLAISQDAIEITNSNSYSMYVGFFILVII